MVITKFIDRIAPIQTFGLPVRRLVSGTIKFDNPDLVDFPKEYILERENGIDFFEINENYLIASSGSTEQLYTQTGYYLQNYVTGGTLNQLVPYSGYTIEMRLEYVQENGRRGVKTYFYDSDVFQQLINEL